MRILNIIEEGRFGGPHKQIIDVATSLRRLYKVETLVMYSKEGSDAFVEKMSVAELTGIEIKLTRPSRRLFGLLKYLVSFIPELFTLSRSINDLKPDFIYNHGAHQVKSVIAARMTGIPIVWHLNDAQTPWIVRWMFRNYFGKMADSIITASHKTKRYYLDDLAWVDEILVSVIPSPVDTVQFARSLYRKKRSNEKKVIVVANINPVKGLENFLEVANIVSKNLESDVVFEIIGQWLDSQKAYSEKLLSMKREYGLECVHFLGRINDVKPHLNDADVYLCTSLSESSPISVLEAICMELPIVSTDVGDLKNILETSGCGKVTNVGDVEALAKHVLNFLKNPDLAIKYGVKGRKYAISNFGMDIIAEKHFEHCRYKTVL